VSDLESKDNRGNRLWLLVIALLLWVFFVYGSFYAVQKPFSADNALALGRTALDLVVAAVLVVLGMALGHRLMRIADCRLQIANCKSQIANRNLQKAQGTRQRAEEFEEGIYAAGLGLGAMGLLALGLGLAGLLYRGVFLGLTVGLLALLWRDVGAVLRWGRGLPRMVRLPRPLAWYAMVSLGLALLVALCPPTAWDALMYHLEGPRLYLEQHRIGPGIDLLHLYFPSLAEMLYLWGMLVGSDVVPQLLHFAYGLLWMGTVYALARRMWGQRVAWLALALVFTMPMVYTLMSWAYNDLGLSFYALAAFLALGRGMAQEHGQGRKVWWRLAGAFCGLALGFKYTAFLVPVCLGVVLIHRLRWRERRSGREVARALLTLGLTAAIVAAPWYLRNWYLTGNPVYPFVFGGRFWDDLRMAWYQRAGTGLGWDPLALLALPWVATLTIKDVSFYEARCGPFLLAMGPVVVLWLGRRVFGEKKRKGLGEYALFVFVVQYLAWMLGVVNSRSLLQVRLLLPALGFLIVVSARVLDWLGVWDRPRFSLRRFLLLVLVITLGLNLVGQFMETLRIDPLPYLVGLESRDEHLTRRLGAYYATMRYINEHLPPSAKVYFLWEPRGYYCRVTHQADVILDQMKHLVARQGDAAGVQRWLEEQGYTHVLVFQAGVEHLQQSEWEADILDPGSVEVLRELEERYWRLVHDVGGAYRLYELRVGRLGG